MPPRDIKGPRKPVRRAVRPSAGPAGAVPVYGPPRPVKRQAPRVGALGPAGVANPLGPRKPLAPPATRAQRAALTHRGPVRTAYTPNRLPPKGTFERAALTHSPSHYTTATAAHGIVTTMALPRKRAGMDAAITRITTPILKDYVDVNANAIPGLYHLGTTAATGHIGTVAKMLAEPYKQAFQHPIESLTKHPFSTGLLFAGAEGAVGRGIGRGARLAPETSAVGRIGSQARAPRTLPGTTLVENRAYSPDVLIKGGQVAKERIQQAQRAKRVQRKVQEALRKGDTEHADEILQHARATSPTRVSTHEIRRRVDERLDANEIIRRQHRAQVLNKVDQILPKKGKEAVPLVAQNITRADAADMAAYRAEIAAHPHSRPSRVKANRDLQKQIMSAERAPNMAHVEQAARAYRDIINPLRAKLVDYGLLDKDAAEMAPLVPYAVRHMGARFDKEFKALAVEGEQLTPQAIRAHMAEHGFEEPAYVTQAPGQRGGKNFYVSQHEAPKLAKQQRTGEATRQGTFDAHPDVLREGAARAQGLVDAHEGYARFVGEVAYRKGHDVQTWNSHSKAADEARDLEHTTGVRWRPVRLKPFAGTNRQVASLLEHTRHEHQMDSLDISKALEDAVAGKEGHGPWGLVPDAAADQLYQHVRVQGANAGGKGLQVVQGAFRKTVLATNPRWLAGNVAEAALRSAVSRAGPRSYITAKRVLSRLDETDPAAAEELRARALGGGHFTMADRMPKRTAEQFEGTRLEPLAKGLRRFWQTPGPRQVVGLWHGWTDLVFHRLNQPLEGKFQTAMLGAEMRRTLMPRELVKMSTRAVDEAAHGLKGTETQIQMARAVDRMYGQYSKFSPSQRRWMALYTPFIAWTLNAVKFATSVLPKDHPVLASLIASAHIASEDWRKDHGLAKFAEGAAPGFLQGTIPLSGGRRLPASRYTPFGAYADPLDTLGGAVLPQFSGVLMAFKGLDWKGDPLKGPDGKPIDPNDDIAKGQAAARSFAEATVPLLGQVSRFNAAPGSTVQRARKIVDPFVSIAAKPPKKKAASSGGIVWGGGGPGGSSPAAGGGGVIKW